MSVCLLLLHFLILCLWHWRGNTLIRTASYSGSYFLLNKKIISQPPTSLFFGGAAGGRPFFLPHASPTYITSKSKVKGRFRINPTCLWNSNMELRISPCITPHSLNYWGKACISKSSRILLNCFIEYNDFWKLGKKPVKKNTRMKECHFILFVLK